MTDPKMLEAARAPAQEISAEFNDRGLTYDNQPSVDDLALRVATFASEQVRERTREMTLLIVRLSCDHPLEKREVKDKYRICWKCGFEWGRSITITSALREAANCMIKAVNVTEGEGDAH